jgi:hypothetical protein
MATTDATELEKLNQNIEKLNRTIRKEQSLKFNIPIFIVRGAAFAIGATFLAGLLISLLAALASLSENIPFVGDLVRGFMM